MKTQTARITDVEWRVAASQELVPVTGAPLTKPTLLSWLYQTPATRLETTVSRDLDIGLVHIQVAQTLQRPVEWVEPLAQVGAFIQVAYAPIEQPDPDLIVALMPQTATFERAMRNFQALRTKPRRGSWDKWYQTMMAAARELVAPLQALHPTPNEALFVLRWAALVAAAGSQTSIMDSIIDY